MSSLTIVLIAAALMAGIGVLAILGWFAYTWYLTGLERQLAVRKGLYRDLVAGLASRDRALLEPAIQKLSTLKDVEALEAVLEEQARSLTDRPAWLLDTYDRLGLVDKYIEKLRNARKWRERAFAAELLGRVGNAKAVPTLLATVQATRTEDADVREIALRALARIADPRAIDALVDALKNAEVWLAPRIADILSRHGALCVAPLVKFLEEPSRHPARAWAANVLGEVKAARAFPTLVRSLGDLDDEVRAKSAGALGRLGDRRAVTYLLEHLLSDPAPFVRARIAGALGQFNDPEVISTLVRALGDPAWWVRMRSVEALEQIGADAEEPLMLALNDPDPEIRIRSAVALERLGVPSRLVAQVESGGPAAEAIETLTKFGSAGARELLAEHLLHASPLVRQTTIEAVRRAGRHDLGAELTQLAKTDAEAHLRAAALEALRELGIPGAIDAAIEGLTDTAEPVRAAAMRLVGERGSPELAETVRPRTADPEPAVRAAAARALGLIRARGVQDDFIRLLSDPDPTVRVAAAQGVSEGGWRETVPHLVQLLGDADPAVQREAVNAVGRLGDSSNVPQLIRSFPGASSNLREAITAAVARLDVEALPLLLDLLFEVQDQKNKREAVRIISHLQSPKAAQLLEVLWRDTDPSVRAAVCEAVGRLGGERAIALAMEGLSDPDDTVRARAIDALIRLNQSAPGDSVAALLTGDPSPLVRERAALATGLFRPPGGEAALLQACRPEEEIGVRAAAALSIGLYDQESIVARVVEMADEEPLRQRLRERLKHDPEYRLISLKLRETRHVELRALSATTREEMEASLAEGMRGVLEADQRIRLVAGLRAFQGERSRGALLQVLRSDPNPKVRAAALSAVAGMLDHDELLLAAKRALADPDQEVRRTAMTLFSRIAPDQALPNLIRVVRVEDDDPQTLRAIAKQAEAAFDAFVDLALGLEGSGGELVMITRVAQYMQHPGLSRLLPAIAKSAGAEVREAVAQLWRQRPDLVDGPSLEALTMDPVVTVRRAAVRACAAARRFGWLSTLVEDPEPEVRRDLALALLPAPATSLLAQLQADPEERVRAAAFAVRLLRTERVTPPDNVSRSAASEALRDAMPLEELRLAGRNEPDPPRRLAAALALALVGDDTARQIAQSDPVKSIRDEVAHLLASDGSCDGPPQ